METSPKELVHYRVEEGVCVLELDDAPANTYSYEMMQQLDAGILRARMDENVQVIVLRGAGEKFFCAGASIGMLTKADAQYKYYFCLHANETLCRLEQTPKLVIAALNGHTVGGGLEVALACDLRVAKKDGGKIGLPEVNLGVLPGTGGTQRLCRAVGNARAIELMATGTTFGFEEAQGMGLVQQILPAETFWGDALAYARQFVPPNKAAGAVGRIKRAVVTGSQVGLGEALGLERELQQLLFTGEDAKEGLAAYVEKRPARFKGK
ncbi:MAG TPA: enoyl-CoA hydratase/isomerase family protein [Methylomirabilota bacterium]|nr:enoyl-CoA hydratase/isomerase family protein [Methylomirabilota bacterium]